MNAPKVVSNLEQLILQPYLTDLKKTIDSKLLGLGSGMSQRGLREQMKYAILSPGKRLRPMLALLSIASVGGNIEDGNDLAAAVEIMHAATLVHDDILDADLMRRGMPTVHERWSVSEAILTGDALLSLALDLMANYDGEVLRVFSETGLRLAEGEYMDLDPSTATSEEGYLERIKRKSAALFMASTKGGAIAGNGSSLEVRALSSFGENFGMAFQIRDDVLDLTTLEEGLPLDLKECRITLPIIHLLQTLNGDERMEVSNKVKTCSQGDFTNKQEICQEILRRLDQNGSLEYCKDKIDCYVNAAITSLQPLKKTAYKIYLANLAESLRFT